MEQASTTRREPGVYPHPHSDKYVELQTNDAVYEVPSECPHQGCRLDEYGRFDAEKGLLECKHQGNVWDMTAGGKYVGCHGGVGDLEIISVTGMPRTSPDSGHAHIANAVATPQDSVCDGAAATMFAVAGALNDWSSTPHRVVLAKGLAAIGQLRDVLVDEAIELPEHASPDLARREARWAPAQECIIYDEWFMIRRYENLSHGQTVWAWLPVLERMIADLAHAPLSPDYQIHLVSLSARIIAGDNKPAVAASGPRLLLLRQPDTMPPMLARLQPLARWRVGHHLYGMANRRAAALIRQAVALEPNDVDGAACVLFGAAAEVQSLTAAMMYASSMSRKEYNEQVRPQMKPPHVDPELAGRMNLDHAAYRDAIDLLLAETPVFNCKDRARSTLYDARDELLGLDLLDLEEHVSLTRRLVGRAPALDQNEHVSAVAELRKKLRQRVEKFSPYMKISLV
jgi:nitrite reductase/ring-hydroxylating ferredoxin subunit